MQRLSASTQFGDWKGTAAADNIDEPPDGLDDYLEKTGLLKADDFLIGLSFGRMKGLNGAPSTVSITAYVFEGHRHGDEAREAIASMKGAIPVREIPMEVTIEQFFKFFKDFEVVLTVGDFKLEGREFSVIEE